MANLDARDSDRETTANLTNMNTYEMDMSAVIRTAAKMPTKAVELAEVVYHRDYAKDGWHIHTVDLLQRDGVWNCYFAIRRHNAG